MLGLKNQEIEALVCLENCKKCHIVVPQEQLISKFVLK